MRAFLLFACFVAMCHESYTKIPASEIRINIFDSKPREFESGVIKSTKSVREFFARHDVLAMSAGLLIANQFAPFLSQFIQLAPLIQRTVEDRSEWSGELAKTIANETMRSITDSEVRWMSSTIQTIRSKIKLLDESNPDLENRKTIASIIHTDFDKMINFFDLKTSLFRRYPLVGAPPLLQIASLLAVFIPLGNALIPSEMRNEQISCKMYDTLLDYRTLIVYARLSKLSAERMLFTTMVDVMSLPYPIVPAEINFERNCNAYQPFTGLGMCLKDEFSTDDYYIPSLINQSGMAGYMLLIRRHIEELIPIDIMKKLCTDRESRKPTGYGWLTVFLGKVHIFVMADGTQCRNMFSGCNPYIQIFINDEPVQKSLKKKGVEFYDADTIFTSAKIPKKSKIKIEIRNSKKGETSNKDPLILSYEGNVDSFLKQSRITDAKTPNDYYLNSIETFSFWRNEYDELSD